MKILHIITGLGFGGAEISLLRLIENSIEDDHLVICLNSGGPLKKRIELAGAAVLILNLNYKNFFKRIFHVNALCKKEQYIITSWLYHADFFTSFLKIINPSLRVVWTVHNMLVDKKTMKRSTIFLVKINSLLSYFIPNKIIYCAESSKLEHQDIHKYNSKCGTVIFNGPLSKKNNKNLVPNSFNHLMPKIGMSARWDPIKNHRLAFASINQIIKKNKKYKNLNFILCGQGINYENDELCKMIAEFSLTENIILLGTLANMQDFYEKIDILLLTSFGEALPNVVIEAMDLKKPIVSTDVGDLKKVVGKTGVISKSDFISISSSLIEVLNNYKQYQIELEKDEFILSMEDFNIETVVYKYRNIWNAL